MILFVKKSLEILRSPPSSLQSKIQNKVDWREFILFELGNLPKVLWQLQKYCLKKHVVFSDGKVQENRVKKVQIFSNVSLENCVYLRCSLLQRPQGINFICQILIFVTSKEGNSKVYCTPNEMLLNQGIQSLQFFMQLWHAIYTFIREMPSIEQHMLV